jgi:hypothetical protein
MTPEQEKALRANLAALRRTARSGDRQRRERKLPPLLDGKPLPVVHPEQTVIES